MNKVAGTASVASLLSAACLVGTKLLRALAPYTIAVPFPSHLASGPYAEEQGGISVVLCDCFVTFHKWLFTP